MGQQHGRGISVAGWVAILVGTVLLGLVIVSQAADPGPLHFAGAFAAGFVLAVVSWVVFVAGYRALRGRR